MRILSLLVLAFATLSAQAAPPVVSNVRASQRAGTHTVDIYYNVSSANSPLTVYVAISGDGGTAWNVPVFTTQGAVGPGVTPGNDRHIQWNAGTDWPGQFNSQCRLRITADDGTAPPAPSGMAYIPGGAFQMGDPFNEGGTSELPRHAVYISSMFMDKFDVTRELWLDVYTWALANGYQFDNGGSFNGANHPVQTVNWYDAVKWCNARSEKAGLTPCYYTTAAQTTPYRTGQLGLENACVKWTANGFRLPTEAEWEKAARGGCETLPADQQADCAAHQRLNPWGDTAATCDVAVMSETGLLEDGGCGAAWPVAVGSRPAGASPYGVLDTLGNVGEWVQDCFEQDYTGAPVDGSARTTCTWPVGDWLSGKYRVHRGADWMKPQWFQRGAQRGADPATGTFTVVGIRCCH